jgi:hypothetical protein
MVDHPVAKNTDRHIAKISGSRPGALLGHNAQLVL